MVGRSVQVPSGGVLHAADSPDSGRALPRRWAKTAAAGTAIRAGEGRRIPSPRGLMRQAGHDDARRPHGPPLTCCSSGHPRRDDGGDALFPHLSLWTPRSRSMGSGSTGRTGHRADARGRIPAARATADFRSPWRTRAPLAPEPAVSVRPRRPRRRGLPASRAGRESQARVPGVSDRSGPDATLSAGRAVTAGHRAD